MMITIQHNNKGLTIMKTYLLTSAPLSAQENYEIIRTTQAANTTNFIDAAVALFWIRELKQYETLGFTRLERFLESQGIEMTKSEFHAKANLGEMLRWVNATREELQRCGSTSLTEIARLARGKGMAEKNRDEIARLITKRAAGLLEVKDVKEQVKAILSEGKVQAESAPKPDPTESEDTDTENSTPDWWADVCAIKAKAGDDKAAFRAMMLEHWGE